MLFLLFGILVLFIFLGFLITKRIFNPLTVFNVVWLIVIGLYQFRLSYLQNVLSNETIKLFIVCIISYSLAFLLNYCFKFRNKENKKEKDVIIGYKTIKKLFIFWIVIEVIETIYSGGLPILWKLFNSPKTYMDYGIPTVHGLMNSIGLVLMMLSYYLYLYKKNNENVKDKRLKKILCIILLFNLCLITRQVIISGIIQMIVINLYFVKKIPWKKLLLIGGIGIIVFGLMGNFRTGYDDFMYVAVMKQENINPLFIGIYWVYMYLTMTVANVNNTVVLGISGYGMYPISSTYIPTVISNILFADSSLAIPKYLVTNAFNVSGFFIDFYLGFGVLGVAVISAIYGFLGGYIFKKVIKNKNEKNILYYAIYLQIILLSFFYNHLLYLPSGFQFIIVFILFHYNFKIKGD